MKSECDYDPFAGRSDEVSEQVLGILEAYLAELERGGRPCPDDLIARHPEHGDALRDYLRELEALQAAAAPAGVGLPQAAVADRGRLGDFYILREVGRGGMGVVYEAEQISLGRRVALKVLPFAATLDARQLQRFKNEAQAAAQLHHGNIVPVYAVGTDRGVHYYAMQFIEGQSLAEVIADLRRQPHDAETRAGGGADTPPREGSHSVSPRFRVSGPEFFRAVARLGVQAAEALEHAHQLGVVHRDVKPANLMLDAAGHLWVTDFGLARGRTEQGLTVSGDLVGTLRYMSPEQALAKHALIDHRSDVYALGVTLYEALTLEPAYPAADREELLRQLALGDPRPPRRVRPSIPVDLETVVLKAMAREPERRYASAQELADDLRRFLEQRPVLAARPTLRERSLKWALRHKAILGTAAAVGALAAVALAVCTVVIWHKKREADAALADARTQSERASAKEAEAQAQRQRAESNFYKALTGTMHLLTRLEHDRWKDRPDVQALRRELNQEGVKVLREFVYEDTDDPALRFQSARAYQHMASVCCQNAQVAEAHEMMTRAFALYEGLIADFPDRPVYRKECIKTHYLRGLLYQSAGQPREAKEEFRQAIEQSRLALPYDKDGSLANNFAWYLVDCPVVELRDPAEALPYAELAVRRAPDGWQSWNTLGVARYRVGKLREAIPAFHRSLELSARQHDGCSGDLFFLAMAHHRLGEEHEARQWYARAVRWMAEHQPPGEDTIRYQKEAECLLQPAAK